MHQCSVRILPFLSTLFLMAPMALVHVSNLSRSNGCLRPRSLMHLVMQFRCGKVYGRHSNSLDTSKKVCGRCHGHLLPLGRFRADGTPAKTRAASAFSLFVKVRTSTSILVSNLDAALVVRLPDTVTAGLYITVFQRMSQLQRHSIQRSFVMCRKTSPRQRQRLAHTPHTAMS